jgi:Sec-independent protein translocase protein TatA
MSFLGIGGFEFVAIFAIALFIVGPKRLAEGVRNGRKYYTELKRYRDELSALVTEAIDADELKKDFEETKREVLDEKAMAEVKGVSEDIARLDQMDDLDIMTGRSVPRSATRARPVQRGDGKVDGQQVPEIEIPSVPGKQAAGGEA